jgi:hypothetical protein
LTIRCSVLNTAWCVRIVMGHKGPIRDEGYRTEPSERPHQSLTPRNDFAVTRKRKANGPPTDRRFHLSPHAALLIGAAVSRLHEPVPVWIRQLSANSDRIGRNVS